GRPRAGRGRTRRARDDGRVRGGLPRPRRRGAAMSGVLLVLSGHLDEVRPVLAAARARFAGERLTVVLRAAHEPGLRDLLEGAVVVPDKPVGGRWAFVRALRRERFAHGIVVWTGAFSFWPAKLAFALARVDARESVTERGPLPWRAGAIVRHLVARAKHPAHATAGMPPSIPWPLA